MKTSKKGQHGKSMAGQTYQSNQAVQQMQATMHASNLAAFNATKKNFPQLNKLTTHKKSFISPYSLKSIQKT
jgi:hypothetical protein